MSDRRLRILLVDDDPVQRRWLKLLSERVGFEALLAADGSEGLAVVRRERPDIIVTDVHMPRMQGPRMLELIRKIPEMVDTPVIVVTADVSRETKIRLLTAGADDFIVKPIDADEFTARLMAQARRSSLNTELTLVRAQRDAAQAQLRERADELERLTFGLITALEKANSFNDSETGNHIRRVSEFAGLLARASGCPNDYVEQVRRYASLHDVGKVGIRDAILKKPGKLTSEEFEEMKTHTLIGADLIRAAGLPQIAVNIPLCHHERWAGGGYPRNLRGDAIPLEARIVAVVDVYDALRSKRHYKPSFSIEKTTAIMLESAGSHLDPNLVELFLSLPEEIAKIEAEYADVSEEAQPAAVVWA
ncbi:MAG: response regulator [Myxococcota bacterium]